jgi:hypothetical protein
MGMFTRNRERAAAASRATEAKLNSQFLGFPANSVVGIVNDLDLIEYDFDIFGVYTEAPEVLTFIDAKLNGSRWTDVPAVYELNIAGADVRGAEWVHTYVTGYARHGGLVQRSVVVYDEGTVFDDGFVPPATWCRVPVVTKDRDTGAFGRAFDVQEAAAVRADAVRYSTAATLQIVLFFGIFATGITAAVLTVG